MHSKFEVTKSGEWRVVYIFALGEGEGVMNDSRDEKSVSFINLLIENAKQSFLSCLWKIDCARQ